MKIGLASIYSFRPHVEHMAYIGKILDSNNIEISYLTCDAELPTCYGRELKEEGKIIGCSKCIIGGVRSYEYNRIFSINSKYRKKLPLEMSWSLIKSSLNTIYRVEIEDDFKKIELEERKNNMMVAVEIAYGSTIEWIKRNKLDAIICFNGRMEITAAIMQAARDSGVRFISQERTWFSYGVQFNLNENCLSLSEVNELNNQFQDKPLTVTQAGKAVSLVASRFLGTNKTEWRAYNLERINAIWPIAVSEGKKVLILPSSHNEFMGHPDWKNQWGSFVEGFEWVIDELHVPRENVVLRCHPNWSEYIGKRTGVFSEDYYKNWANSKGYNIIDSRDKRSTFDLIKECDVLVVNGSSAAVEAGFLNKLIICIGRSAYEKAGFTIQLSKKPTENLSSIIEKFNLDDVARKALRHVYTMYGRFPFFVNDVVATSSIDYVYNYEPKMNRFLQLLEKGVFGVEDESFSNDLADEDYFLEKIKNGEWELLQSFSNEAYISSKKMNRIFILRWVDSIRKLYKRGDV